MDVGMSGWMSGGSAGAGGVSATGGLGGFGAANGAGAGAVVERSALGMAAEARDSEAFLRELRRQSVTSAATAAGSRAGAGAMVGANTDGKGGVSAASAARAAAEDFVSLTFVQPLFKQLRSTSMAKGVFAPSQAEKQFQGLADAEIAKRLVRASKWPLVDRIAKDLEKRAGGGAGDAAGVTAGVRTGGAIATGVAG